MFYSLFIIKQSNTGTKKSVKEISGEMNDINKQQKHKNGVQR